MRIAVISVHGCPVVRAGEKDTGGMNVYLLESARALARQGVQVDVFTRRHDPCDPEIVQLAPGARVVHLDAGPLSADKTDVYPLLPDFCAALESFRALEGAFYDLIWTHYWLSGLVGLDLRKRWGIPHATCFHTLAQIKLRARAGETEVPQRDRSERRVIDEADQVIVWTDHERDALMGLYGADPDRVCVIPPGVDSNRFRPLVQAACRDELELDQDCRLLLYVGRLERLKGVHILLRALATLEDADDVNLLVVGGAENSPERDRLRSIAREGGVADRVRFVTSVGQEKLIEYYNAADVCVLPSYYESFGLAALEAAACGRPVVASSVGGLPSIIQDGVTGYLVRWRCPGPFVERLEILLANDHLRREMGLAARHRAEELSWDVAADTLLGLFGEMARAGVHRLNARATRPVPAIQCGTLAD